MHGNITTQGISSLFSVRNICFISLMTPIDYTNDQNIWAELFTVTFTYSRLNYASKKKLETTLSSLLY